MFQRIKMLALAAATVALLLVGSTAMAAPGWRGGFGVGIGRGYGGYGYRGGYVGGYGGYYGGYRGYSPGYYGGSYPGYYGRYTYGYPGYRSYYPRSYGYYGGFGGYPYQGISYSSVAPIVYSTPSVTYATPSTSPRIVVAKPAIPDATTSAGTIKLKMPSSAQGSVSYELNGTSFTMNPGYAQTFANDRNWTITFDDGSGHRESYSLTPGNFEFSKNAEGRWELRSL